jgi:aerobic carbon-monoxide dehydrogenase medium subunit
MKNFGYVAPKSQLEAFKLLSRYGEGTRVMAGGTDLLVELKNRDFRVKNIIDLKNISELSYIKYQANTGLQIGALTKVREIETSSIIRDKFKILSQAAGTLGSVQIRNKASIGGNLCHAAPSADTAPALISLEAKVKLARDGQERSLPLEEFFLGPGKTVLNPAEILKEISLPPMAANSAGVYLKYSPRQAMDLAMVGVACVLTLDETKSTCLEVRLVLGAVAPTPIRARKAEALLKGQRLSESLLKEAARSAREEARPITDIRASEWYRRDIIEALVERALKQAVAEIKGRRN